MGAGMAGLAAARTLVQGGHEAVVFEAEPEVGGRVTSVAAGAYVFDSGATAIAPRGRALEKVMFEELSNENLRKIEAPIYVHNSLRVSPGDSAKNRIDRYCYLNGNSELPRLLAQGLDIRPNSTIAALRRSQSVYEVGGELFEAVVLTLPTPLSQTLLESIGETRPFTHASYRPCLSVMLGYAQTPPTCPYHALLDPESGHPLVWLSIENHKCEGRVPEGKTAFVAQLGPQFSKMHFESDERVIVEATADLLVRLYGKAWDVDPEVALIKRWLYSQPEMTALFDSVNRAQSKLLIAGDGVMGSRVEYAYDSGLKAARMLMEHE